MATNIFVYWSDGLGDQAFDHHSRNEGRGNCQQKLPAGPGICPIFSNAQGLPREVLAAGIDSHISQTFDPSSVYFLIASNSYRQNVVKTKPK